MQTHPLDNPVRSALLGPHARFARRHGQVLRYPSDMSPFVALPGDVPGDDVWRDVAALYAPDEMILIAGPDITEPDTFERLARVPGVQMVASPDDESGDDATDLIPLGDDDVAEMLDLTGRTKPGPFLAGTIRMGPYLGVRRDGALVAMAGERLAAPGFAEVSAVCTDPAWRGHGFAGRLVRAVAAGIRKRGDTPLLHTAAENTSAVRLYESLGFRVRREVVFTGLRKR